MADGSGSSLRYGEVNHLFYPVTYADRYPAVDFFRSLGRILNPYLTSFWYAGDGGKRSACADDVYADEKRWHKRYWDRFYKIITTKLETWAYEREQRLVITELMTDFTPLERRKLTYEFADLEGIIFGMNTPEEKKFAIVKIIQEKCKKEGRTDFKFYQAYYDSHAGKIEPVEMSFLKFNQADAGAGAT